MAEYIERSSAAAYFENSKKVMWHKDDVVAAISSSAIPTADVAEVRHARWDCVNESDNVYMCAGVDGCGGEFVLLEGTPLDNDMIFCPYCGAKMDGKGENDG